MKPFRFYHSIEVRYGDLDAQGHVNNARYFTYMEQARVRYLQQLGLWDLQDFEEIGVILAEESCTFRNPIRLGDPIRVGVRVSHLGTKSLTTEYRIETVPEEKELASGKAVLVAYNYHLGASIPLPDRWRNVICEFEGLG
ncbi:MAG: thioesterase family protein [Anaerolineales bacterium]|jgi:acyl-CoA thioester hydrolase